MKFLNLTKSIKNFSLETVLIGRNDDYEPDWARRLESTILYNKTLFDSSGVDFRVAFVEWNPPKGKPLLSAELIRKFNFVRAVTIAPDIHNELCGHKDLTMMLNFAYNAGIRTSTSDFMLISSGDVFWGRNTARWLRKKGLKKRCPYRAMRIDIRSDLDFLNPQAEVFENRKNIVRNNECDKAPYINACGDFILMDRDSLHMIRGFDENIRHARLHLDSRCCYTAMDAGLACKLIGHIYHINHRNAFVNLLNKYPGQNYDYTRGIPYKNQENWGLQDRNWQKLEDRLYRVS